MRIWKNAVDVDNAGNKDHDEERRVDDWLFSVRLAGSFGAFFSRCLP